MPLFYFRLCDLILLPGFLSPGLSSQPGYPRAALEDTGSINVYTRLQNTLCCSVVFRRIEHFFLKSYFSAWYWEIPYNHWRSGIKRKAQFKFCPGLYFYPSPLYLGLTCLLHNQLESMCSFLYLMINLTFLEFRTFLFGFQDSFSV